jgi:transposase
MSELLSYPSEPLEAEGRRHTYSGLFKARIIYELINRKRTLKELSEQYKVHPNQIKNWKSILLKQASDVLDDKRHKRSRAGKLPRPTPIMTGRYAKS